MGPITSLFILITISTILQLVKSFCGSIPALKAPASFNRDHVETRSVVLENARKKHPLNLTLLQ